MRPETIQIPAPVADRGATVEVCNYRRGGQWEEGTVSSLSYENAFGGFMWGYRIRLSRVGAKGPMFLHASGDSLRLPGHPEDEARVSRRERRRKHMSPAEKERQDLRGPKHGRRVAS